MNVGAERNKVILLVAVSVIAAYAVYSQFLAGPPAAAPRSGSATNQASARKTANRPRVSSGKPRVRGGAFRPSFGSGDPDEPLDPMTVDPTLRTDLLAKVRAVEFEGVERNLFRFGERRKKVEPPSPDKVAEAQKRLEAAAKANVSPDTKKAADSAKKKAPPIQFKYYGFANEPGSRLKRAFLLDGEDILIGGEGDVFKKRYEIVRIGLNGIVMKDLQFDDEQTLRLEEI